MSRDVVDLLRKLPPEYAPVHPDGSESDSPYEVEPLGTGGSSIVVRATYRGRLQRAVKIMRPRPDLAANIDTGSFVDSFLNETDILATITHQNLSKLTDFGTIDSEGAPLPFVVTEFIDGPTAQDWFASAATGAGILTAVDQVLAALEHLHRHEVMHCDIKPANILLDTAAGERDPTAVVVDLGVSRYLGAGQPDDAFLYFFSTERYVHPGLRLVLANRSMNRIRRDALREFFPHQDLYSVGVIVDEVLTDEASRDKLEETLGRSGVHAVRSIRDRLLSAGAGAGAYRTAAEVRTALSRVPLSTVAPLGIGELTYTPSEGVSLPTGRMSVPLTDRVQQLVDHPAFQRLHKVPQLDLLHFVRPGAHNTRFQHALHSYSLARDAVLHLLADWEFRLGVAPVQIEALLLAALLRNVSVYQFTHMFEDLVAERTQPELAHADLIDRDAFYRHAVGIAEDEDVPPAAVPIVELRDARGRSLAAVLRESTGEGFLEASRALENPGDPLEATLSGLLSSPVDVDKLAYLMDDSVSTGMRFGQGVDPDELYPALVLPGRHDWVTAASRRPCLALREGALSYLEASVLARYWQIQRGYWHRTNRAVQTMVKHAITSLILARSLTMPDFVAATVHSSAAEALRWIGEQHDAARSRGQLPKDGVNPVAELLESRRHIYKRLVTISPRSNVPNREPDHRIYEGLIRLTPSGEQEVAAEIGVFLSTLLPDLQVAPGEVLLDIPRRRREQLGGRALVYTDDGTALLNELFVMSPLLDDLQESFDQYAKRMRVYVSPRILESFERSGMDAHAHLLEWLRERYAT